MCPSVGTPWASTPSPSFVQRSNRESSASSLTWSRKLSSFGFVRFDIGVEEGTAAACLRECQKLGLGSIRCVQYFHCISTVPSELLSLKKRQAASMTKDCRTERTKG